MSASVAMEPVSACIIKWGEQTSTASVKASQWRRQHNTKRPTHQYHQVSTHTAVVLGCCACVCARDSEQPIVVEWREVVGIIEHCEVNGKRGSNWSLSDAVCTCSKWFTKARIEKAAEGAN